MLQKVSSSEWHTRFQQLSFHFKAAYIEFQRSIFIVQSIHFLLPNLTGFYMSSYPNG